MKTSKDTKEIAAALSKFQGEMGNVKEDKVNPYFKSSYASIASIWTCIRPHLTSNGLSVIQEAVTSDVGVSITTRIQHCSGQFIEMGPFTVPVGKKDAHSTGSSTTYGRRYAVCAALGLVSDNEDDDGNRAQQAAPPKETPKEPPAKPKPPPPKVDIDDWYIEMEGSLCSASNLRAYVEEAAKVMKKNEQLTINFLASQGNERFNISFGKWQKQRVDNDSLSENEVAEPVAQ